MYCFWTDVLLIAHLLAMMDTTMNAPRTSSQPAPDVIMVLARLVIIVLCRKSHSRAANAAMAPARWAYVLRMNSALMFSDCEATEYGDA